MNYAVLSFFHNCFLLLSLHFCIKSTIKIVVVVVVAFFKTGDFVFKTPACFAIWFGLGILSYKVSCKERSSFALLTTISSEMHQWQSFLYHALASAQFFTIII